MGDFGVLYLDAAVERIREVKKIQDNYNIIIASDIIKALNILNTYEIKVVVCCLFDNNEGLLFLRHVSTLFPKTIRLIIAPHSKIKIILPDIKDNIIYWHLPDDYIIEELEIYLQRALKHFNLFIFQNELAEKLTDLINVSIMVKDSILSAKIDTKHQIHTDVSVIVKREQFNARCKVFKITPKEQEIAELIQQNYTNIQIADKLHISEVTVKVHIGNMFKKTSSKNRLTLVNQLFM